MSQSLGRALDLLELVSRGVSTLDALAEHVGVHKTTVLRLLQTLEHHGYVRHDRLHRYRLASAIFALGESALQSRDVRAAVSVPFHALGAETGLTVHLASYSDGVATYIDKLEPKHGLRMYSHVGLPAPLHATAVGKVLLGGLEAPELHRVVESLRLERFTDRTITMPEALTAEVRRSAEQGWAEDRAEHETFMNCIGAPIRGADGRIAAAVSISAPDVVVPYQRMLRLLPVLRSAAAAMSQELGARPS
jgi:DNA-binding IclR family transcriptional regulator